MEISVSDWYSRGNFADINSQKIFYIEEGDGFPLLCIHGFPTSSWDFESIWSDLAKHFRVIGFDMLGLGKSAKPDIPLTVAMQADIAEQVLVNLGVEEFHILAHDLGDTVAQELIARHEEGSLKAKIKSCVFLNGGLFPETHRPVLSQKLLISPLGKIIAKLSSKKTYDTNMRKVFSDHSPPSEDFLKYSWQLLSENNGVLMLPRLIRYMDERREKRNRWVAPLQNSQIPLRLIDGVDDPVSGAHMVKRYEELITNPNVVRLDRTGHYPQVENPEGVLQAFLDFHDL